jgi:hypothetical protein
MFAVLKCGRAKENTFTSICAEAANRISCRKAKSNGSKNVNEWHKIGGVLLIIAFIYFGSAPDRKAAAEKSEKDLIPHQASLIGRTYAQTAADCFAMGHRDIKSCANNSGPLPDDTILAGQAKLIQSQLKKFFDSCTKYYTTEYCGDLLRRAQEYELARMRKAP